jgi:hypothetical protein
MRKILALLSLATASSIAFCAPPSPQQSVANAGLSFAENKGQWDSQALYLARLGNLHLWITGDGAVYDVYKGNDKELKGNVVKMSFVNSHPTAVGGSGLLPGQFNYFTGNDPNHWATGVHRFAEANADQMYKGISVRYYFDNGWPRYDLLVAPGADPSQVQIKFEGADGLTLLPNGDLQIATTVGVFEQKGLTAYQQQGATQVQVPCHMTLSGNTISFATGSYDASKPLVIDPLLFSTYLGGSNGDYVKAVKVDNSAIVLVAGDTESTNFPTTVGAYDRTGPSGGFHYDAFVGKLLSDGSSLIFGTYMGGSQTTHVIGMALDSSGNPVIVGNTAGTYPTTTGAYLTTYSNASAEGYVTKVASNGASLMFSTYLGGSTTCYAQSVAIDPSTSNVYVGGFTTGAFPTTSGTYQTTFAGSTDGYIAKLNSTGTSLLASTLLGPGQDTFLNAIALNGSGNPVVAGYTDANSYPTTVSAYRAHNAGSWDGFVTTLNSTLTALSASTLFGGSNADFVLAMALDSTGEPMVTGYTLSSDYPHTTGAIQISNTAMANRGTAFYTKINATASALVGSTYYGAGTYGNQGNAIAADSGGNAVIVGDLSSGGLTITPGAYQITSPGGNDAFVARISSDATSLFYGTYFGGGSTDQANALALDAVGVAHFGGETNSTDFPTSSNAYQKHPGASFVATGFVSKLKLTADWHPISFTAPAVFFAGNGATATITINTPAPTGGTAITITSNNAAATVTSPVTVPAGGLSTTTVIVSHPTSTVNQIVTMTATSATGTGSASATFTVKPAPLYSISVSSVTLNTGQFISGYVVINGDAPSGGDVVNLVSSNPSLLSVPSSITIAQNWYTAGFDSGTAGAPNVPTSLSITASLNGVSKIVNIIVYPNVWLTVPSTFYSGNGSTGTVHLASPAGGGGQLVNLASTNTGVMSVQPSVTVASGASTATFTMTSHAVASSTNVTINATSTAGNGSATTTVVPAPLYSVTTSTSSVTGGTTFTGTVTINGLAPAGGAVVSLSSNNGALTVPATVTIAAGNFHSNFTIHTSAVGSATVVKITATYLGVNQSVNVTVH